jgi:DNA polymerase
MSDKAEKYRQLVAARKMCERCKELVNPSRYAGGKWDSGEIGPWTIWQGNLDAELMVVGQDWGDIGYFEKYQGCDAPGNPTNQALRCELLPEAGFAIEEVGQTTGRGAIFLTNAILCLKKGKDEGRVNLSAPVQAAWFRNCGPTFLRPQVELILPRALVTLGEYAYRAVCAAFGLRPDSFRTAVEAEASSKPEVLLGVRLFPVYHPSPQVMRTGTRSLAAQRADWRRIGAYLGRPPVSSPCDKNTRAERICSSQPPPPSQ